jgi:hypothetical protein
MSNKYKVCYYTNSNESSVTTKVFESYEEAIEFADKVPTGDVLEIKRIENGS